MASQVPHLLHIHVSWGTRLLMARLPDKQHIRHKNAFFFIFSSTNKLGGTFGGAFFFFFLFQMLSQFCNSIFMKGSGGFGASCNSTKTS